MPQHKAYTLTSGEIGLRPLGEGDIQQRYVDWLNDPEVNRFLETRHQRQDMDAIRAFVAVVNAAQDSHLFGIFHIPSAAHLGNIKVGPISSRHLHADVSLFLGERSFWGRGCATAAIACITRYGFTTLGLLKLEAGCYEQNVASRRAFEKCGYAVEGILSDHLLLEGVPSARVCLGLTRKVWLARAAQKTDIPEAGGGL